MVVLNQSLTSQDVSFKTVTQRGEILVWLDEWLALSFLEKQESILFLYSEKHSGSHSKNPRRDKQVLLKLSVYFEA